MQRTALKDFQGGLKKERPDLIQSLKETIKQKGFDAPIYLRYEHDNLILDGHQRLKALNELASEGELLPADNIPCIYIKADTLEQAKEKVVEYNTRFSEMDRKEFAARVEGLEVELLPLGEFGITPLDVALQPLEIEKKSLTEEFGVPPFSVLDTKQGYRIQRKQERLALGIKSNVGREQTETT
ncbi:MAG: ParB/RepB/Spo0J family partition protein [Candidatus Peribacteria bacterium]|nr:ParB/RepB/Spo0J family partition protein [Candidatus Peribacteria bacterium]